MIILGIDPGTRRIGYGVIESEKGKCKLLDAGILKIESKDDSGALLETRQQLEVLIKQFRPDIFAIEKLYFAKNQKTAFAVAQARGALLLSAIESNLEIREFTPNEVKLGVAGDGSADKKAILKMVKLILNAPKLDVIDDASDALAVAIMASNKKY